MEKTPTNQPEAPQKLPKLTKKQRGFVKDYVETENGTQSALKNYDIESPQPEKVANAIAVENLLKPSIINAIEVKRKSLKQALLDKGIDENYLAGKVNVLLTATDEKGNTDFTAVDKGLKHASSWYGVEDPNDKPKIINSTYIQIFNPETQLEVRAIESIIKARLLNQHVKTNPTPLETDTERTN